MNRPTCLVLLFALTVALPAVAGPPPAPWVARDIGTPPTPGSTDVDANGVWTLQGNGKGTVGSTDQFHFVSRSIKGDATFTARFLKIEAGGNKGAQAAVGLMVRENDTPGAAHLYYFVQREHPDIGLVGLGASARFGPERGSTFIGAVGPSSVPTPNLYLRLQRVGQEVAGFYSEDGQVWTQADFPPLSLSSLQEEALFGLAVMSRRNDFTTTGIFDQVNVQPGASCVYGIQACGADRSVLLQWRPLKGAIAYNVYRGPMDAAYDQLVKLSRDPVAGTSFTDMGEGLVNGTPALYAVAALFPGGDGQPVEGPRVAVRVTPVSVPPGLFGCSLDGGPKAGSAAYDPATGEITLKGSGLGIWGNADQGYFLLQPAEGDFQVTVKMLTRLKVNNGNPAGLLIRESLDPAARNLGLFQVGGRDLYRRWRNAFYGSTGAARLIPPTGFSSRSCYGSRGKET